jgi:hypothetical protein
MARAPAISFRRGSPMNAPPQLQGGALAGDQAFAQGVGALGARIPKPKARFTDAVALGSISMLGAAFGTAD